MNQTNKEIKDHFDLFTNLLNGEKVVLRDEIQLVPKNNNARWLCGTTNVKHKSRKEDIVLYVERSKRDSKYSVKLRCSSLCCEPFFRFDSDGPAHRNNFPEIPLEDQYVPTPHFNSYKSDGKPIAYRNESLKMEKRANIIATDINFGVSLFCMETNSRLETGKFPEVKDNLPEFEFDENNDINFDLINFD
jgi:hypothetical protein